MIITCPLCHQSCETDANIEFGQRIQCPFCDGKFAYEGSSRGEDGHRRAGGFCTACGASIRQGAAFCTHCGHKVEAPEKSPNRMSASTGESMSSEHVGHEEQPQIDLSNDQMAALWRWLKIVRGAVFFAFAADAFAVLCGSLCGATIFAAVLWLLAGNVMAFAITKGQTWSRILTWVLVPLSFATPLLEHRAPDVLEWLGAVLFALASIILLLPSVSSGLKAIGAKATLSRGTGLVFSGMIVVAMIVVACAPESKGLLEYHLPKEFPFICVGAVGVVADRLFTFLTKMLVGGTQELTGVSVGDVEVVSSRKRNATCPKCGQVVSVPDTDENDQVECPSCQHAFYPFGTSSLAYVSFYLGLISILIIPAPFALWTGKKAVKEIKAHRGMHGMARAKFGIVCGWVGISLTGYGLIFIVIWYLWKRFHHKMR